MLSFHKTHIKKKEPHYVRLLSTNQPKTYLYFREFLNYICFIIVNPDEINS